jgi:hypothetical protein
MLLADGEGPVSEKQQLLFSELIKQIEEEQDFNMDLLPQTTHYIRAYF